MSELQKIVVLYGGNSPEREVSLVSGQAVEKALKSAGYETELIDLTGPEKVFEALKTPCDLFFPVLHGSWGEDGRLQAALDLSGRPYVGSGPLASGLCMDKWASKALFDRAGLHTPKGVLVRQKDGTGDLPGLLRALERYGKLIVKPNCGGSTVATSVVSCSEDLLPALNAAWEQKSGGALVEEFIPGRELTVAMWDSGSGPEALPAVEILPASGFYDYQAKYTDGASRYESPARLSGEEARALSEAAVAAWRAVGLRDYGRADFRLPPDGEPVLLEINTAPGMTSHSLVPMAAKSAGMELPDFLSRLAQQAWSRDVGRPRA